MILHEDMIFVNNHGEYTADQSRSECLPNQNKMAKSKFFNSEILRPRVLDSPEVEM
jgi:hypothetical protein